MSKLDTLYDQSKVLEVMRNVLSKVSNNNDVDNIMNEVIRKTNELTREQSAKASLDYGRNLGISFLMVPVGAVVIVSFALVYDWCWWKFQNEKFKK